jgi:broad specificity phosphatase PhoE
VLRRDEENPRGDAVVSAGQGNTYRGGGITRIFLVRHGATEWNRAKRAQGHADIELNDEGRTQAETTAQRLATEDVVAVYSSDLVRSRVTAEAIAGVHNLPVITDPDLREVDQGEWTGLHVDEIARRWPGLWGDARHHTTRPGGESPQQVRARSLAALARIVKSHPDGSVVVVSHGGTIRWISAEALRYDDRASARIRGVANGGIVSLDGYLDGERLVLSNLQRLDGETTDLDDPND